MTGANIIADDTAALTLFRQWREALDLSNACSEDDGGPDKLDGKLWAMERQIFDTPMPSAIGMAVKACVLIYNENADRGTEDCYSPDGDLQLDVHALKGLAEDAARLVPETKPLVAWILDVPLMRPKKRERKPRRGRPTLRLVVNNGATAA
jgi:hypothetical protein